VKSLIINTVFTMFISIAVGSMSFAGSESGNGGDTCLQSVPVIKTLMIRSISAQGQKTYPEFDFSTLNFFQKRTVIEVISRTYDENGRETDATSYPSQKKIQLSRARWCDQNEASKASLLFHEYLVVMELEQTGVYDISSRFVFIDESEEEERQKQRWVCTIPYHNYIGGTGFPSFRETRYSRATGATALEAFDSALRSIPSNMSACYKVQANLSPGGGRSYDGEYKYDYYCSEAPTVANSCVQNIL